MDLSKHKLIYADEFDNLNLTNGSRTGWNTTYHYGDRFLGNEQQVYVDPNYKGYGINPFSVSDGVLTITAQKAPVGFEAPSTFKKVAADTYTSGLLNSEASFSMQYGYYEIRAEMPAGKGLWPAFWLLQSNGEWPAEYDVVEVLGHDTKSLHATSHWKNQSGSNQMEHQAAKTFDAADGFHTYGFDWTKDKITWYYDGVKVFEAANRVTDQSMYMLVNLAVGGDWPGKPNAQTTFPAEMKIDYVRVYQAPVGHAIAVKPSDWKDITLSQFSNLNESSVKTLDWKTARASWDFSVTLEPQFTAIKMMNDWAHYIKGNDRDNYIEGGSGKYNELDGGKGNDVYKGGAGLDVFVVRNGDGNDRILDFSNTAGNTDKLKLDGFHFDHFDELAPFLTQHTEGVMLRLDIDQAVFFNGLKIADLKPEQFIFVNSVAAPVGSSPIVSPTTQPPVTTTPTPSTSTSTAPNHTTLPTQPSSATQSPAPDALPAVTIRHVLAATTLEAATAGSSGVDLLTYSGTAPLKLAANIEGVTTTGRGVQITGNSLDNYITANGEGYNRLSGEGGNDVIKGGDYGNDLNGGAGSDRLEGGRGTDFFQGGSGDDTFVFKKGTISRSGALDHIGDFEGAGRTGGDVLVFDDFQNGSLRFSSYHQVYDSKGKFVGVDETKQYYNLYDNGIYEGSVLINNSQKMQLSSHDYLFT